MILNSRCFAALSPLGGVGKGVLRRCRTWTACAGMVTLRSRSNRSTALAPPAPLGAGDQTTKLHRYSTGLVPISSSGASISQMHDLTVPQPDGSIPGRPKISTCHQPVRFCLDCFFCILSTFDSPCPKRTRFSHKIATDEQIKHICNAPLSTGGNAFASRLFQLLAQGALQPCASTTRAGNSGFRSNIALYVPLPSPTASLFSGQILL